MFQILSGVVKREVKLGMREGSHASSRACMIHRSILGTIWRTTAGDGYILLLLLLLLFFRAAPAAYGGSQARGRIRAIAASLCQSHSNAGSEPHL